MSDWMKRQKDCPNCRKKVTSVTRSFQCNNAIEMLLNLKPELKKSKEVIAELEAKNIFKSEIYMVEQEDDKPQ